MDVGLATNMDGSRSNDENRCEWINVYNHELKLKEIMLAFLIDGVFFLIFEWPDLHCWVSTKGGFVTFVNQEHKATNIMVRQPVRNCGRRIE